MVTIIFPFRGRDIQRVKRSINSLKNQISIGFRVVFIDYGSDKVISEEIRFFLIKFSFIDYIFLYTRHQPWSKSKAINFALNTVKTTYCLIADIDMIFHPEFTKVLEKKCNLHKVIYFQVGFLSEKESKKDLPFEDYKIKFLSNEDATGISLFPIEKLRMIQGFDEFFHFWGAEDTDVHNRIRKIGCEIEFYDKQILMLHQWHKNYRNSESEILNISIQLTGIIEINKEHMNYNFNKEIELNDKEGWGKVISEAEFNELESFDDEIILINKAEIVDHFIFVELPQFKKGILSICFVEDAIQKSMKYKVKKIIGKKVPKYYTLKEINDKLLLHIISFYHQYPYFFSINDDLKSISFRIKK